MTVVTIALVALSLSAIPLLVLCIGDPKRRRTTGDRGGTPVKQRRILAVAASIPGMACLLVGNAASFMLWLGGSALAGWAMTKYYSGNALSRPADNSSRTQSLP